MQYSELGSTGLQVSKICLGTMTFGEQNTESEGHEQLDYALSQGVNFIDTAEMYSVPGRAETQGSTERIIGTWLKARQCRADIVLASKITGPSAGLKHIRNPLRFTPEQIRAALEGSLQRLQTDYIDLYQLHWPERKTNYFGKRGYVHDPSDEWADNFQEVLYTMGELVKAGKIRHFGLSNETPWGLMRCLHLSEQHGLPRCVSIQNPYSLLNRTFEQGLAEVAIREQTGLLAYSPMAFGLLSGKYHRGEAKPTDRINKYKQLSRYNSDNTKEAAARYLALAEAHGLVPAQMALAFVNSRPFVTATIVGATSLPQLKINISSIELQLPAEVLKAIDEVQEALPNPAP